MARMRPARQFMDRVRRLAYRATLGPTRPEDRHQNTLPMPGTRRGL